MDSRGISTINFPENRSFSENSGYCVDYLSKLIGIFK